MCIHPSIPLLGYFVHYAARLFSFFSTNFLKNLIHKQMNNMSHLLSNEYAGCLEMILNDYQSEL